MIINLTNVVQLAVFFFFSEPWTATHDAMDNLFRYEFSAQSYDSTLLQTWKVYCVCVYVCDTKHFQLL